MMIGMFFGLPGGAELLVIVVVVLLLFASKRLPEAAKSFGRSIVEFKRGMAGEDASATQGPSTPPPPPADVPATGVGGPHE